MNNILNISNGDGAIEVMKRASIRGDFLPWRDFLHDGPVPGHLSLESLSKVRAQFIAASGFGTYEGIHQQFIERDNLLKSSPNYDKVILWFEHDLYDQLQLLQLLDWFNHNPKSNLNLSMICIDDYLATLSPDQMKSLCHLEKPVTGQQRQLASKAWAAFGSDTAEPWQALRHEDTSDLPFLKGAIDRLLEEYPSCFNGLSRSSHQALSIIASGEQNPARIFGLYQQTEQRKFMGDSLFFGKLNELINSTSPLLKLNHGNKITLPLDPKQTLAIEKIGLDVLSGKINALDLITTDRWLGGVHLSAESLWCWDNSRGQLKRL